MSVSSALFLDENQPLLVTSHDTFPPIHPPTLTPSSPPPPKHIADKRPNHHTGHLLLFLSGFFYAICNILTRAYQQQQHPSTSLLLFLRGLIFTAFSTALLLCSPSPPRSARPLSCRHLSLLVVHAATWALSVCLYVVALRFIVVGDATAIAALTPVFTILLASLALREQLTVPHAAAAACTIAAFYFFATSGRSLANSSVSPAVATPSALSVHGTTAAAAAVVGGSHAGHFVSVAGISLSLLSAALVACSIVCMRALRDVVSPTLSVLSVGVATTLLSLLDDTLVRAPAITASTTSSGTGASSVVAGGTGVVWAFLAAVATFAGQLCFSVGVGQCGATAASLWMTVEVPMTYGLAWWWLDEGVGARSLMGAVLVVASVVAIGVPCLGGG